MRNSFKFEFLFVHSYSSAEANWSEVMIGTDKKAGRVRTALEVSKELDLPVIANDAFDAKNRKLYQEHGIENILTAYNTQDEVKSVIERSAGGRVLFITSPDHLPRVARDAMAAGCLNAVFMASQVPFSQVGPAGVTVTEPNHTKRERG